MLEAVVVLGFMFVRGTTDAVVVVVLAPFFANSLCCFSIYYI